MEIPAFDDGQDFGDSMLDEIRRTAERRLHQIEPLLEEAQRLRDVLEALDGRSGLQAERGHGKADASSHKALGGRRGASALRSRGASSATRRQATTGSRAAKGSNKRAILDLVASRPGITAAEISEATGMKRTVAASTVSRLKRYGELLDYGSGGVCVPAGTAIGRPETPPVQAAAEKPASREPARTRPRRLSALQARRAA